MYYIAPNAPVMHLNQTLVKKARVTSKVLHFTCYNNLITWRGDCLQTGKLSGYVASHLGQLSLLPSVGW